MCGIGVWPINYLFLPSIKTHLFISFLRVEFKIQISPLYVTYEWLYIYLLYESTSLSLSLSLSLICPFPFEYMPQICYSRYDDLWAWVVIAVNIFHLRMAFSWWHKLTIVVVRRYELNVILVCHKSLYLGTSRSI